MILFLFIYLSITKMFVLVSRTAVGYHWSAMSQWAKN